MLSPARVDVQHGVRHRRLARRDRDGADAALERGHPLLEHVLGRVHDPRVDVARHLQGEEIGGVLGVVEDVRRRLVDRHRPRVGRGSGAWPPWRAIVSGCSSITLVLLSRRCGELLVLARTRSLQPLNTPPPPARRRHPRSRGLGRARDPARPAVRLSAAAPFRFSPFRHGSPSTSWIDNKSPPVVVGCRDRAMACLRSGYSATGKTRSLVTYEADTLVGLVSQDSALEHPACWATASIAGPGGGVSSRESGSGFWARAVPGLAAFGELRAGVGLQRVAHPRRKSCEAGGPLGTARPGPLGSARCRSRSSSRQLSSRRAGAG